MEHPPSDAPVGALVRFHRHARRLSQEELAARAGLGVRTIRDLESGQVRRPRRESVELLVRALGLGGVERARLEAAAGLGRPPEPPGAGPGRTLPRDVPDFTGRQAAVAAVESALLTGPAASVPVVAVSGPAGVGKSALAVHVAHRLRDSYPDGQLYVPLRGQTDPVPAGEVLGRFLRALGVDPAGVPADPDERAARFRARLTGLRLLVVLDDAATEAQVRPLLPGTAGCAVLVTSRPPLVGLEGVVPVALDVLDDAASVELLDRVAGPGRVAGDPAAAREIAAACGRLPLALRIAGALLATAPGRSARDLAAALADERGRLDELTAGDLAVRSTYALAYQGLDGPARAALRGLGLLGAADVADWTVAALLDTDERTGRRVAARLAAARLVDVTDAGRETRYGLHDLVRLYARERAEAEDLPAVRQAAVRRALSGWAALADEADRRLPSGALPLGDRLPPGWRPEPAVAERLLERPLGWFERERAALVAAVRQAAGQELELCAGLADSLVDFCATRDYSDDWAAVAGALLDSAEAAGDRRLAGHAERRLAELALYRVDEGAGRHAERAVELTDAAGDGRGAAAARIALGAAYRVLGRPAAGRPALERALAWYEAAGDRHGTGHAVNELGMTDLMLGDEEAGRAHLSSSVRLLRENGDLRGEARALMALGTAESRGADPAAAVAHLRRSMELSRELDDRSLTVISAVLTGRLLVRLGDTDAAMPMLAGALAEAREQHRDSSVGVATLGLGEAHLRRGEPAAARERFRAAREVFVAVGMLAFQGLAEVGLGDVALAEGDPGAARAAWERALPLLDVSAPPRAADLRTRLADLATS